MSENDKQRYARQILLPHWGEEGQEKLKNSTVFVAGAGGLGSPASMYLAVAGVGCLRVCDHDSLELTNLNRQILHSDSMIGKRKAESAKLTLERLNPSIEIVALDKTIDESTVDELVGDAQIIVDCMDNFPTRFVLNKCAARKKIPFVYGSVWGLIGYLAFIKVPETPCLSCVFCEAPPKETFPVVGATPGVIGSLEALETLKYLTGVGENLRNKLLLWYGDTMEFRLQDIRRAKNCPVCSSL
ncbi:MAG: HesA/MoeB/ThiF family protein [Candidatus Omnitrophica bacterium]|nr:HesA/MoeB/ThiF family protein [Candidatus Omnitrophota bacterium]